MKITNYIGYKEQVCKIITCSHPKVKRIWEYGGGASIPTDGTMYKYVAILLNDESESHIFFKDADDAIDSIEQAEIFLQTLPMN